MPLRPPARLPGPAAVRRAGLSIEKRYRGGARMYPTPAEIEALKSAWTDQFVRVRPGRPELERFAGRIGRVITVNFNGKALVDFADGAWYDVAASETVLEMVPAEE